MRRLSGGWPVRLVKPTATPVRRPRRLVKPSNPGPEAGPVQASGALSSKATPVRTPAQLARISKLTLKLHGQLPAALHAVPVHETVASCVPVARVLLEKVPCATAWATSTASTLGRKSSVYQARFGQLKALFESEHVNGSVSPSITVKPLALGDVIRKLPAMPSSPAAQVLEIGVTSA